MSTHHIIVSKESLISHNPQEIIDSNANYITKLFQNNIHDNEIYEDALRSYYLDYYFSNIQHLGFKIFMSNTQKNRKILTYISDALHTIKLINHFSLFSHAFPKERKCKSSYSSLDRLFKDIQVKENLQECHAKWLKNHPQLLTLSKKDKALQLKTQLQSNKKEQRHIQIIKQLCHIVNEEFIRITAGDRNNPYHKAWHFKTDKGYYYSIEKENIVTMYNSFTKKEVIKGRLISNKTDKSLFSNFITKIWA